MDPYLTCPICGKANEFNRDICSACGNSLSNAFYSVMPDDAPTLSAGDSNRSFGFGVRDLEFADEGVSANAAQYLKRRFRPISPISKGGMGKLFLVQELLSGRFVALKVMLASAADDMSLVQQFMREAVITARLQHPHIIPVHELGFLTEGQLYYTMRYVEGKTLDEVDDSVDLDERLRILRSAATAVNFAHKEGLWHRDLKPNNILIGLLGDTYVIDWGLVSVQPRHNYQLVLPRIVADRHLLVMPDNLLDDTRDAVSTTTGRIVGTPAYMSPEQIMCEDSKMGSVSDVWAFGIMLFEAITGRHPIENVLSLHPLGILDRIMDGPIPSPKTFSKDVPEVLDRLCQKMLNKDPSQRMHNLNEFTDELTQYLKSVGKTIANFGTFSDLPNMKRRRALEVTTWKNGIGSENDRLRKKIELLSEIAQLGFFSVKRRKELWRELARL